jgi:hypothetical protein
LVVGIKNENHHFAVDFDRIILIFLIKKDPSAEPPYTRLVGLSQDGIGPDRKDAIGDYWLILIAPSPIRRSLLGRELTTDRQRRRDQEHEQTPHR